ncbi:MAG TPA: thiolase domain-containing protein [Pseudomonadales bacterium]
MREVAIISYVQTPMRRDAGANNDVEMLMPTLQEALSNVGMTHKDIDFTCSGSCDYLGGAAFAFVSAVDALGAVPAIAESHVEMDAAWALYEAWLKIQCGKADTALVYGFGKSSHANLPNVLSLQMDPYSVQPLWPDSISMAALQARALLESGKCSERDMAEVVANSRRNAKSNPKAQLKGDFTVDQLLREPTFVSPLRKHDCCPITDGASVMILAVREKAEKFCKRPAFITGIDHRIDAHGLGLRDLTVSESTRIAGEKAGANKGPIDVAELYAPFSHQELILRDALGLDATKTKINPSGGALAGHVFMACGLDRIGAVATRIINGEANRGVAHATSGPCLQQNLVAVLEG